MGLNFGSDEIESLALGDTPLEALMLGEVELWSAGGGGGAALEPMEWSYSGSTVFNPPTTEVTLVNYTVVGTGVASIYTAVSASGYRFLNTRVGISRTIRVYVNGDEVGRASHTSDQTAWLTKTFPDIELRDGDTFEVTHEVGSGTATARRNWTIRITPQ